MRENRIFDPGNSYLTVRIEISRPRKRLENITAKNKKRVFNNNVATSHEERKLVRFFEKFTNLQNI